MAIALAAIGERHCEIMDCLARDLRALMMDTSRRMRGTVGCLQLIYYYCKSESVSQSTSESEYILYSSNTRNIESIARAESSGRHEM